MHRCPQYTRNGGPATLQVNGSFWPGNGQVDRVEACYAWNRSRRAVATIQHGVCGCCRRWHGRIDMAIPVHVLLRLPDQHLSLFHMQGGRQCRRHGLHDFPA